MALAGLLNRRHRAVLGRPRALRRCVPNHRGGVRTRGVACVAQRTVARVPSSRPVAVAVPTSTDQWQCQWQRCQRTSQRVLTLTASQSPKKPASGTTSQRRTTTPRGGNRQNKTGTAVPSFSNRTSDLHSDRAGLLVRAVAGSRCAVPCVKLRAAPVGLRAEADAGSCSQPERSCRCADVSVRRSCRRKYIGRC